MNNAYLVSEETLRQVLDVLETVYGNINPERGFADELEQDILNCRTSLRTILASPPKEPVAWITDSDIDIAVDKASLLRQGWKECELTPLYMRNDQP